ncbi:MAG: hypothetical protein ACLGHN_08420 [Bacteriovoracia bacterium]
MKVLSFVLLFTVVACDPYGFGFKKNPGYVLEEAFKSIMNLDVQTFLEVTGKEALCVYGNEKGLTYLKDNNQVKTETVKLEPKVLLKQHFTAPKFAGYWSYYNERYEIQVKDKESEKLLLVTYVDCDYGTDGEKDEKWLNLKPSSYKVKECRAVKIVSNTFQTLPVPEKCNNLRVVL